MMKWDLSQGYRWHNIDTSVNVIHHINNKKKRDKSPDHINRGGNSF